MNEQKETDNLKYEGNDFPVWLIVAWVLFTIFFFGYFVKHGVPDLLNWTAAK